MPKLSKRKRQLKEIYYRKNESEGSSNLPNDSIQDDGDEEDNNDDNTSQPEEMTGGVSGRNVSSLAASNVVGNPKGNPTAGTAAVTNIPAKSTRSATQKQQQTSQSGDFMMSSSSSTAFNYPKGTSSSSGAAGGTVAANANANANANNPDKVVDDRVWVQCNTCDKWRALPSSVNPDSLPDIWTCDLNVYDPERMACDAPEESYYTRDEEQQHVQLKSFLRLWVKKLKTADRAETRLSTNALTRGRKRKLDIEWIKCCNPHCGKWRAISRGIDTAVLLKRLNKNRRFGEGLWYCAMNSWDETTASCAAPQEPLWNCRWNLNST